MSVLTTKQIMEIIPHRQPFLLIDTIEELEIGTRAVGKNVSATMSRFSQDIFRGTGDAGRAHYRSTCTDRSGRDFK